GFAPQTGRVTHLVVPDGVRWDGAVVAGSEITPYYDPMIAKLITHGSDRETARRRLGAALDRLLIGGLVTNAGFQRWLIEQPPVVECRVPPRFLHETAPPASPAPAAAAGAAAWVDALARARSGAADPWHRIGALRITPHVPAQPVALRALDGTLHEITPGAVTAPSSHVADVDVGGRSVAVNVDGYTHTFTVPTRSERWAPS